MPVYSSHFDRDTKIVNFFDQRVQSKFIYSAECKKSLTLVNFFDKLNE